MAGPGGYRKPTNPAPVSGPGAMSRRTDTQPKMPVPGAAYGEQAAMQSIQGGAPMLGGQQSGQPAALPQQNGPGPLPVTPFNAPTQRPDEPVTAGAVRGPGPGPASMGITPDPQMQKIDAQDAMRLVAWLPALQYLATRPGASLAMKTYVRQIKTIAAGAANFGS